MTRPGWSLRRRLTAILGVATFLAWGVSSLWLYRSALEESDELFDAALDHTAHAVLAVVRNEASELSETKDGSGFELAIIDHSEHNEIVYQVLGPNGGPVFRSHGAPVAPLADAHARGFGNAHVEGKDYRVYTLATELNVATIHVGQPMARRVELARSGAIRLLAPGAALMVVLAFAVTMSVRRTTEPVVRYANALDHLKPESEALIDGSALPQELQPVTRAIDGLLARVHDALLRERTLTADAAHELRTPLAALRLQAQVARRAKNANERDQALDELISGTDRAARMVDSVLTLARFDASDVAHIGTARIDMARLGKLVLEEFRARATARGVTLEFVADASQCLGDEDALAIALRNLIENALRFASSRIRVQVQGEGRTAAFCVRDNGPGFNEESARRAFHRFFRGPESKSSSDGAGLGLALVARIAQLHGGGIEMVPGLDGGAGLALRLTATGQ